MQTGGWLTGVRAVVFDAVGTLITPDPPAPAVYAEIGRKFGSRLDRDVITARFRTAFRAEEEIDRAAGWRTDEAREERRWRTIVAATLTDVEHPEACFRELWQHFCRSTAWRFEPAAGPVIAELRCRGLAVGIASNFDDRLRTVVAGLPELASISALVISSEVGWRKPASAFFDAVVRAVRCSSGEVLHIGDDRTNDYEGALAAGLAAVLYDSHGGVREFPATIVSLAKVLA
jgi:putative hydrolase of the HAD superfamily